MSFLGNIFSTAKEICNELFEPNDFKLTTWLAMGASLLLVAQSLLPGRLSNGLPLAYLGYRLVKMVVDTLRLHTGSYTSLLHGRWTATLPEPESPAEVNSGSDGIVIFLLGARINQCDSTPSRAANQSDDALVPWESFRPALQT